MNKSSTQPPAGLLQPLAIPKQIWEELSLDFIPGLPPSKGFTAILVVVDRLRKSAHFLPLKPQFTALSVAELFVQHVVKLHGFPKSIVADRDPLFLSKFWQQLFSLSGTELYTSTAYHPQSDGQTEVVNRCVEQYLRCFSFDQPSKWSTLLHWAEFSYNTSYHSSINMTPLKAVYGRSPPSIKDYTSGVTSIEAMDVLLKDRKALLSTLQQNIQRAQLRMKTQADKQRKELQLEVGSWAYIKLQPHRQISVSIHHPTKLSKKFYGPFQIIGKVGPVANKLDLPPESKIHNVFHISILKRCPNPPNSPSQPLPELSIDNNPIIAPQAILNSLTNFCKGQQIPQVLVQWQGLPLEETSWEDMKWLNSCYPTYNLEDKVSFNKGGNDTSFSQEPESIVNAARIKKKPKRLEDYILDEK